MLAQKLRREIKPRAGRIMIRLELYNQNYDSKINEFPTRNAILRIYYLIKDNIEQETFAPMLVLPQ